MNYQHVVVTVVMPVATDFKKIVYNRLIHIIYYTIW
jgi:hypothetical protein